VQSLGSFSLFSIMDGSTVGLSFHLRDEIVCG
jgi:hypothetical protein